MSEIIKISLINEKDLPAFIDDLDKATRAMERKAARGEGGWICADCCCSFPKGMPEACQHGDQRCTEIIQRDKREAMREGNEPI